MTATAPSPAVPPGPRLPRALQTIGWAARPGPFMTRCRDRYGDTFSLRIAHEGTWVFVTDPDAVKQVFTGDPRLLHAGAANVILLPLLGHQSVLLLDGPAHLTQRKLLLPPFHGERMQAYGDLMARIAEEEIARWPAGEPVALWPRMQAITLEIIMRAVFGIREADRLDRLRTLLGGLLEYSMKLPYLMTLLVLGPERADRSAIFNRARKPVDEMLFEEIGRRRRDPDVSERDDILSLLVQARHEDGSEMSDTELRDQLMTLLVAGHETTATALAWAIERLVRHPEKLARLRAEAESGEHEYADAVVKETLRLRPVLPIVVRRLAEPMEIGGHLLPAGVTVAPCIYLMHRRADIYPEPERFRPERFLEQPAGTYTWIPFGGGVRRCLGASFAEFEMRTVLSAIVRSVDARPAAAGPELVRRRAITLTPSRGAEVVLEKVRDAKRAPATAGAA